MIANSSTTIRFLLASRQCELNSLCYLLQRGELVGKISQLVHMLQRERGTSNMFLCAAEGQFADELSQRARDVAGAQAPLLAQLDTLESQIAASPQASRLFSHVASVIYALSLLPALRQQIRQRKLPLPQAMSFFNDIIRHLLSLVFELTDTAAEPDISRALIAMFSFMQGKEFAGQERAIAAAAFAAGQFSEETRQKLLDLIERQERCFATFADFADEPHRLRWQQMQTDSQFERLRRIACTGREGFAADSGLRWFALATQRIDAMKIEEDALAQTLMAHCRARIAAAEQASHQQQADIESLMPQPEEEESRYSVFIDNHGWLESGGVRPQLGRSLLTLVQQQSRRLQALDTELAALRETLNERKQIERAKSLLMQHRQLSEEEAYKTLRSMAMNQNKKLVEIAGAMLAVADVFPLPPKE
ncbi:transcription antitermination regulator [Kosakonia radicincitans]|uniref:nitrate regulatory protein n=1 Tax=Kosakonia radicincitans TaxID=283686 RepID=UPI000903DDB0|nr:nitrate regulatory protein [Kosakonia radicincitans]APG19512.1 transcription antitermination regulator [Kosakonia radicincitans]